MNLCLRVIGRRDDGYHLLDSIFVPVDLYDRIVVEVESLRVGGDVTVHVRCPCAGVPEDDRNLAGRAARVLLAESGHGGVLRIAIEKVIPPGAGLGGGSGNAATVLAGLNDLLGLGVPAARLHELALHLGADVPFFLVGRPARVGGIGERIEPIAGWPGLSLVVAIPPLAMSTAAVFRVYATISHPEGGDEPARLAAGAPLTAELLVNDLERAVLPAYPAVAALKRQLLAAGAGATVMSGSGSAVVGLVPSTTVAEQVASRVRQESPEVRAHAVRVLGTGARGAGGAS